MNPTPNPDSPLAGLAIALIVLGVCGAALCFVVLLSWWRLHRLNLNLRELESVKEQNVNAQNEQRKAKGRKAEKKAEKKEEKEKSVRRGEGSGLEGGKQSQTPMEEKLKMGFFPTLSLDFFSFSPKKKKTIEKSGG